MLPSETLRGRKRGFAAPLDEWIRRLGRPLAEMSDGPLVQMNLVRREAIQSLTMEHLAGVGDHRHRLWALLVLDRWLGLHG